MELLQAMSGGLVAAAAVFIVAWLGKERYDARFDALQNAIKQIQDDGRQTRAELASLRSDLLNVALRTRPEAG